MPLQSCRRLYQLGDRLPADIILQQNPVIDNRINIGNISSRPASISPISTNLEKMLYALKLQVGPTASSPGPILLKHASTAERFVSTENPSMDIIRKLKITMIT